jgi:hypothetical protein
MFIQKFKALAQTVGIATIGLLMFYGAFALFANAGHAFGAAGAAPMLQSNPISTTVPAYVNYQGTLRDPEGNLLTGVHKMTFRIYKDVTDPLPEAVWMEEHSEVTVRNGHFSVMLGDLKPVPSEVFYSPDRFIGITIDPFDEMVPRQRFASVPYAFASDHAHNAGALGGKAPADYALLSQLTVLSDTVAAQRHTLDSANNGPQEVVYVAENGNVGINTKSPLAKVHMIANTLRMEFAGSWLDINTGGGRVGFVSPQPLHLFAGALHLDAPHVRVNGAAPVRILRFENVGNDANFNTGIPAVNYHCVAAGWSTRYDIEEDDAGINSVWTYVSGATWWARVSLRSHNDHENPDVDIVCFRTEFATWEGAPTWLDDPS